MADVIVMGHFGVKRTYGMVTWRDDVVVMSVEGQRKGSKQFWPASLMGQSGYERGGNEQGRRSTRILGTGAILAFPRDLTCSQ